MADGKLEKATDTMHAHLIWAHPRIQSLTARVVEGVKEEFKERGVAVRELDLYRSGFDPILREPDEPEWANPDKVYSPEVMKLAESLTGPSIGVVVFPIWWYSVPAILKGYMDRVWNYGLMYGNGKSLPFASLRWIALVGGAQHLFSEHGWEAAVSTYLNNGMARYLGVEDSQVAFLYNTIGYEEAIDDVPKHHGLLIQQARETVAAQLERLGTPIF